MLELINRDDILLSVYPSLKTPEEIKQLEIWFDSWPDKSGLKLDSKGRFILTQPEQIESILKEIKKDIIINVPYTQYPYVSVVGPNGERATVVDNDRRYITIDTAMRNRLSKYGVSTYGDMFSLVKYDKTLEWLRDNGYFSKSTANDPSYTSKTVPVIARIVGNPQSGYWVCDKAVTPGAVDIIGPAEALERINGLELSPIQLDGAASDMSIDFDISDYLKDSQVSISENSESSVTVTVKIEKENTANLSILIQNIAIIRDNIYLIPQLPTDPIPVTLQGPADVISGITNSDLRAELDLSGLNAGTHDVALRFDLPANVSVKDLPITIRVVISEQNNS